MGVGGRNKETEEPPLIMYHEHDARFLFEGN